jgi:hypothetical protein
MNVALRKIANPHLVRALSGEFAGYESSSHKLLSDNRALYIVQSANTRAGKRADFPSPSDAMESAIPVAVAEGLFSSQEQS